ncbi:MAG: hypothetical protein SFX74_12810 [Fimbriimonadaceae bacterium]|nr:hypothetical protein [Fimbriimonadaceae bacterium]
MRTRLALVSGLLALLIIGCDNSQDLPPGASLNDPTGANAKQAASGNQPKVHQNSPEQDAMAKNAQQFGQEMNQKYKNR